MSEKPSHLDEDQVRRLLLERHYGLLDGSESLRLDEYLASHPDDTKRLLALALDDANLLRDAVSLPAPKEEGRARNTDAEDL